MTRPTPASDAPPAPAPDAAVIIPHYNDPDRLARCLEALAPQDRRGVEVLVVDNASPTGLDPLAARFPWVRWLTQPIRGAGPARNLGAASTGADWLFFLDSDCVPAPDWLSTARDLARGDPDRAVGGQVTVFDETPPPRSGAEAFETVFAFDQAGYIADKGFSVTANLLVARAVFEAVGSFDAHVSEDYDWCLRARALGYGLDYAPSLSVAHPTRSDWPALRRKWLRLTTEAHGLARRDGLGGRVKWMLRALAMAPSIPAHAPRILRHPELDPGDRMRALGTLARLRMARMGWMLKPPRG